MTGPQLGMMSPHAAKDSLWLRLVVFYQHCHPERLKDSILDEVKVLRYRYPYIYLSVLCTLLLRFVKTNKIIDFTHVSLSVRHKTLGECVLAKKRTYTL